MRKTIHPSWHFYTGVWGVVIGIVASLVFSIVIIESWFWLIVSALILIFSFHHARVWTLVLALIAGLIVGNFRAGFDLKSSSYFSGLVGTTRVISGVVSDDPTVTENKVSLRLDHLKIQVAIGESITWAESAGILYIQLTHPPLEFERSDRITFRGKIGDGFGNFIASMFRPEIENVERAVNGDFFARLKSWFATNARDFIPSPSVDLGLGYLVGMKSGLPENLSTMLQAIGMTHVVVASGAHLGILINAAKKFFGKISRFSALLFSLLLIFGFVLLIGGTPSMTRAALVSVFSLLATYVGRRWTPFRLISFVAMITLFINPRFITNLGWQLSFASFFGLLLLTPLFQKTFYGGKRPSWLVSMFITSAATSLLCAPILIYNFGSISLLSFIANLVIIPTLPYAMLLVFLTGIFAPLPALATFFGHLSDLLLQFHIYIVELLSEKKAFIFELPSETPTVFLLYIIVLLFLTFPPLLKFLRSHRRSREPTDSLVKSKNYVIMKE